MREGDGPIRLKGTWKEAQERKEKGKRQVRRKEVKQWPFVAVCWSATVKPANTHANAPYVSVNYSWNATASSVVACVGRCLS